VDLEAIATAVVASVSVAGLVGWVRGLPRSRVLQAIVSCLVLSPGATAFAINQWQFGPW
jgi:ABC-type glucose/galactose transport system permease subunit